MNDFENFENYGLYFNQDIIEDDFQPDFLDILQFTNQDVNIIPRRRPKPYHKRKSVMSIQAQRFREMFFLIFTKKKKFPKTIIWEIHKIIQEPLHLFKITRDIIRDNDKYFERFSNESAIIIQYLQNNKHTIISLIPELKKYE